MRLLLPLLLTVCLAARADDPPEDPAVTKLIGSFGTAMRGKVDGRAMKSFLASLKQLRASDAAAADKVLAAAKARLTTERTAKLAVAAKALAADPVTARARLASALAKRRRKALGTILNKGRYPAKKKKHTKRTLKAQEKVDLLVADVQAIWATPAVALLDVDSSARRAVAKADTLAAMAAKLGLTLPKAREALADKIKAARELLDLSRPADEESDTPLTRGLATIASNRKRGTQLTESEREQIALTNRYRMMMGLEVLTISKALADASRKHSEVMVKRRIFSHVIKGHPHGVTHLDRARRSGYSGLTAENIFHGNAAAKAAHDAWLHSAGHHRNILGPQHTHMGAGNSGSYWTQLFGRPLK